MRIEFSILILLPLGEGVERSETDEGLLKFQNALIRPKGHLLPAGEGDFACPHGSLRRCCKSAANDTLFALSIERLPPVARHFGMTNFADRLSAASIRRGNPVVVGLDPRWQQLPPGLEPQGEADPARRRAAAYRSFCRAIIDVVADLVPAVKPQVAFFEQLGPAGMVALADVMQYARQRGLLVIADGKRNDIGTTAEAYADGWLGEHSPWGGDALTVSPYLGADSLDPFVKVASERGGGLFVLVKTSNPGGGQFQDRISDGQKLYEHVGGFIESLAEQTLGTCGFGAVGAVVGATYPEQLKEVRHLMPHTYLLVPGYGSQGGTARDCAAAFDQRGLGAVINNSRGIIFAHARKEYAERFGPGRWLEAVEAATRDMIAELRAETTAGRLGAT